VSLWTSFNSLFGIDPGNPWAVVIIFSFILVFEWVGGLASVAMTDCIQGFIVALSFIMTAIVVKNGCFFSTPTKATCYISLRRIAVRGLSESGTPVNAIRNGRCDTCFWDSFRQRRRRRKRNPRRSPTTNPTQFNPKSRKILHIYVSRLRRSDLACVT
jgi:Na+(H+)/acetate symporter ActP